ncbi:SIMPL domain-containing protein [uncultured Acetobacteroides sp.]|uniref:SIMPL domain-containing protein n=1 Tax=uncultured Acetobacteroides sp. TaxID=1760811 RepID=UPI0029F55A19|nr:SIMPL domain-containing protein [uncultured Acetobacteroides sp.]
MKKALAILALLLSTTAFGQQGEKNFIDQNYIEVTGKSEMEIAPDKIYIKIVVNEKDIKGKSLAEIETSMVAKLQEIGIDTKKDLAIKDVASNFKSYWLAKSDIILSKEYQLLVHDGTSAGKAFVELQSIGISNVSIDRVESSKIVDYRKEVKLQAIKAAQEKAKALTEAIGQNIGRALFVREVENDAYNALQGRVPGIVVRGYANSVMSVSDKSEQNIEFEKIKLEYSVFVRFDLK